MDLEVSYMKNPQGEFILGGPRGENVKKKSLRRVYPWRWMRITELSYSEDACN